MSDKEKKIHAPDYDGPDRRTNGRGRRPEDFIANNLKLVGIALGIGLTIFSMGGAWVGAKMALDRKVDRDEWVAKNAEQDQQRATHKSEQDTRNAAMAVRQDRFENIILVDVIPMLKRLDNRVSAIYCFNKPAGCQ